MSPNIFELMQQFCPDGVEYRRLGEVFKRERGTSITAARMKDMAVDEGDVRVFAGGKTEVRVFSSDIPGANILKSPSVLVQSRGVIDVIYCDEPFTFKNEMWAYTHDNPVSVRFLFYLLKCHVVVFRRIASKMGSMPQISLSVTDDLQIPVPPLPVQQEIVRILDTFDTYRNDVTAGLAGELAMRRKQFQYWQEKLLSFDDSVPRKALGEVASIDRGVQFNKKDMNKVGAFPVINGGIAPSGYVEVHNQEKNTLVISQGGASAGYVNWMDVPFWAGAHCYVVTASRADLSDKYLYYVLKVKQKVLQKAQRGSGIPALPYFVLEKLVIPIPPLAVQQEIVRVLDVFVELERELERELELRAKQFEYYRDHLLAFPEKKGA